MSTCPRCRAETADGDLACPGCGALVHAETLRQLYDAGQQAEQRRDWEQAAACFERCLQLLPPATRQYRQIESRSRRVAHLRRAASEGPEPPGLESPPPVTRAAAEEPEAMAPGLRPPVPVARSILAAGVESLRLLLRGLTRPRTVVSMGLWVVTLSWLIGWRRAVGFAAMVYVHEMGHLILIRMHGLRFAWPFFVPFLGAFVLQGGTARPREDAMISLAGPSAGMALSAVLLGVDRVLGLPQEIREMVHLNTIINLLNLLPVWILDGGRIAECCRRGQVLAVGLALLLLSVWPFSAFGLLLGAGFAVRAGFWRDFEAVSPVARRSREGRGDGVGGVLVATVAVAAAGGWLLAVMPL